jgi:hypothetical protein
MYIDGEYLCDTLEDEVRPEGIKIYGKTAIPYGVYQVTMSYSPKFERSMPLILNVPNFEGVRIHSGNSVTDTEGCVLVGRNKVKGGLVESRFFSNALNTLLTECKDDITLHIRNPLQVV